MSKLKTLVGLAENPQLTKTLLAFSNSGYLYESGWVQSFIQQMPVNKDSNPLPWVTLPFIDFLQDRLTANLNIYEYGSGNSTFYFAKYVKSVTSIEHDKDWFDKIAQTAPTNVSLNYCELVYDGEYCRTSNNGDKKYHLIIVDGRDRVNCIKNSLTALTSDGCIVLDDSERPQYKSGREFLVEQGFKYIDFWGMAPGLPYKKCTTIFYKNDNAFNI